jgi:hypothetical protein
VRDSLDIITSYKDVWNNTILFEKNVIGETKKLTYPNGYQTRTVTNKYGKPDSVILATNKVITYTYDNTGHLLTKNFPNGMRLSILRDGIYRPIGLLYTKQNGAATDTLYYQWCHRSATGDIDTFSVKGSAVLKPTAKSVTKTNTFQPNDAPTSNGTSNFTNNPNGAVTNQTTANGTLQVHSSFVENDLLDTLAGAPTTQKMAWNGLEKLVGITRNGVQTRFVQDCTAPVAKLLQTQTAQGTTTGTYIHDYIGPAAYIDSAGVFSYYAFDLFGNTVFLTNDNGQVVDKYAYDLYCTQVKHIGDSKQLFCGLGQHGALTINDSTLNIQSRFLQTPRNCFMSKDRAVFDNKDPMTLHKYIYANNNTVAYYDLNGWQCTGKSTYDKIIDGVHFGLDVIGTFDPTPISDGINAGIYAGQGDYVNAGISAAGMIPYFGDAGKVAKYGNKAMHLTQDAVKVEKTIWSSGKNLTPIENALSHSNTHREEFEGIFNAKQYVEQAKDFLHNSPTGTLSKIRESDGAIIKYNESTNTFGVMSSDGIPRTFFKPSLEKHNYSTNLNYFLHQ